MGSTSTAERTVKLTRCYSTKDEAEAFLDGLTYFDNPLLSEPKYSQLADGVWSVSFLYRIKRKPIKKHYIRSFLAWLLIKP